METKYFVLWFIRNKETQQYEGTIVDQYDNLDTARKNFHAQASMYIDDPQFDSVAVMLMDSYGNRIENDYWTSYVPEPTPEPNAEG